MFSVLCVSAETEIQLERVSLQRKKKTEDGDADQAVRQGRVKKAQNLGDFTVCKTKKI